MVGDAAAPRRDLRDPDPEPDVAERRLTRGALVRGGVALAAGAAALAAWPRTTVSAPSAKQDAEILRFALTVEDLQAAFYADAIKRGALSDALHGELLEFAQTVGDHERAHAAHIRRLWARARRSLGASTSATPTPAPRRFAHTAIKLEELGLAAYNGAATSLTPDALADASRIVSVEARHAGWIRDMSASFRRRAPWTARSRRSQAQAAIARTGFAR